MLCILGTIHLWLSMSCLRINLGRTRLTLVMNCPNLHKYNYENHYMNMYLELQKLNTYT